MKQTPTSPYVPDLDHLREWLEKMVAAMKFVELILAIVSFIARMRDINLELTKRVAHLTRKRPRSENPRASREATRAPVHWPGQTRSGRTVRRWHDAQEIQEESRAVFES